MEGENAVNKAVATPENLLALRNGLKKCVNKPPQGVELRNDPTVYRRDLLRNWIWSRPVAEINEITELENMFVYLKGTIDDLQYQRYMEGNIGPPSPKELAYWKHLTEILVSLNKMKYGEKKTNVNVGFSYENIQEMMLKVHHNEEK